ncbi:uncharacterized protein LOC131680865 [Topomyia yanbarensis]|uniref:uncharacterized protein LOC131680865 n=1 Tax=Topomyia yanbarensis TaxID=2498891 RepID=UPI00273A9646|nr:uncharacterized protein LOC131680865 [Topomyia yanbarensis]
MEMLLVREDIWHIISEPQVNAVTDAWTETGAKVWVTIGLCIEDDQASLVHICANAKDIWDAVKTYHNKGSEVYLLKKLMHLELKEGDDMGQHLQTFSCLLQRIANVGDKIPEKLQVAMLYHLVTALEQRPRD